MVTTINAGLKWSSNQGIKNVKGVRSSRAGRKKVEEQRFLCGYMMF
jgi:hypothetical protein